MKTRLLVAGLCIASIGFFDLSGQVHTAWMRRFTLSEAGANQPVAMSLDARGDILIAGHGTSTNGDYDYVVLKYRPTGDLMWSVRHAATPNNDLVRGMAVDAVGNTVLTGSGGTVRIGADGTTRWALSYQATSVAVDPSGNVYLAGFSDTGFETLKIHGEAGTNLWLRTETLIPGNTFNRSHFVTVDGQGNAFISGLATCYSTPRLSYGNRMTVSYDSDGARRWTSPQPLTECRYISMRTFGSVPAPDGKVIVVSQDSLGSASTIKYSANGEIEWTASNGYADHGIGALTTDAAGFVYITGKKANPDTGQRFIRTDKFSPTGSLEWVSFYEAPSTRNGNAIAVDGVGNVLVAGQVPGLAGTEGNDFIILGYSSSGREFWVQRYDGPAHGDDVATAIAVAPDGSIYVTGWSTTSSNLVEITTIKYVPVVPVTVQANGDVALEFVAPPGQSNRVEATVEFLEWLDLGYGLADTNGLLRFLDTNAHMFPHRFYRTKAP